jgi:hypothetical protein
MSSNTNEPDLTPEPREIRNPGVSYDLTDLSARAVIMFLVFLALGGIIISASMWGLYKYLASDRYSPHPTTRPIATRSQQLAEVGGDPAVKFPPPRLQPDPVADLNKFRAREEEILNSYGWVDRANGKVHIPIERAIDLVAQVGLPVRPSSPTASPSPDARGATGSINVKQAEGKLPSDNNEVEEQR